MSILGTAGDDIRYGTTGDDLIDMSQGGNDKVVAGDGDDTVLFGATFTAADSVIGGDGWDKVVLDGDYSAGLVLASASLRNVEELELKAGHSYDITMSDGNLSAGQTLKVSGYGFSGGQNYHFDGSAETKGTFLAYGSAGDDRIIGGQADDYLIMSYGGADVIDGQGGDDIISAGDTFGPGDIVDGGAGNDLLYLSGHYATTIQLNAGNFRNIENISVHGDEGMTLVLSDDAVAAGTVFNLDTRGLAAGQSVKFFASNETDATFDLYSGAGDDFFVGGAGNDLFRSLGGGSDVFAGNGGDDYFLMGAELDATDRIYGGTGYDGIDLDGDYSAGVTFNALSLAGIERFTLREGHSYKLIFDDNNLQTGEHMLISPAGDLGAGNAVTIDASKETSASYSIYDSKGNDTLIGGGGDDDIWLTEGGSDIVKGNDGNDTFLVGASLAGDDKLYGGAGTDTISFGYAAAGITVDLAAGTYGSPGQGGKFTGIEDVSGSGFSDKITGNGAANYINAGGGNDTVHAGGGNDTVYGNVGADSLFGEAGADYLGGLTGADILDGGIGNDWLDGGTGADKLIGGAGADRLTGGAQDDMFVFKLAADSAPGAGHYDTVTDFSHAQGDRIDLRGIDAQEGVAGNQVFAFLGDGAFTGHAGELRYQVTGGDVMVYGDTDGNAQADFALKLEGVTTLVAADFLL